MTKEELDFIADKIIKDIPPMSVGPPTFDNETSWKIANRICGTFGIDMPRNMNGRAHV